MYSVDRMKSNLALFLGMLLFLLPLLTWVTASYSQTLPLENEFIANRIQTLYSDENSLLANEANTVIQTEDGYMWIGSYSGLMKFDGKKIAKITSQEYPEFTAQSIRGLYESKNKVLYIATNDEGLYAYSKGAFKRLNDSKNILSNSARAIFEDSQNNIYVATTNGLGKVVDNHLEVVVAEGFTKEFIISGAIDHSNNMWLVCDNGNLIVLNKGKVLRSYTVEQLGNQSATHVFVDGKNRVIVGTNSDSVLVFENGKMNAPYQTYALNGVLNTTTIFEDQQQILWVGGEGGFGYFDAQFSYHPIKGTYLNGFVEKIYQDYEGNYWVASSKQGVLKLTNSKFTNVTLAYGLESFSVNSTKLWGNELYVGTDKGLMIIGEKGMIENELTNRLKEIRIRSLNEDKKGNLWISTYGEQGVVRYNSGHLITNWNETNGLPKNKVRTVLEGKNGDIYVATTEGIAVIKGDQIVKTYTDKDGLTNPYILSMCEDKEGNLYAGSDGGGIFRISKGRVDHFSEKDGLSSGVILRMAIDERTGVIFISAGGKLNIWEKGKAIKEYKGFKIDANIFDIKAKDDKLVLLASNGLYILKIAGVMDGDYTAFDLYDKYDGLNSFPVANSWNELTDSGELYISGGKGVYKINIFNIFKNKIIPKFAVNYIEIDGVKYHDLSKVIIPSSASRVSFDISVMSFSDPNNNEIEYRLEGFDQKSIVKKLEGLNAITYTNLDGGKYTFKLKGSNSDGIQGNKHLEIKLQKELGIFENPLTYLILIFIFVTLTITTSQYFYRVKEEKILLKQQEYKKITKQAIEAISRTIDAKDHYTSGHSQRVANYSVILGKEVGMTDDEVESLYYIALLHDIGKIAIPDEVLNKGEELTDDEFEMVKNHVVKGDEILKDFVDIKGLSEGALYHHEKYDGSGYVFGLNGEDIPLNARIIAIADTYDAMATKRSYRDRLPTETILNEIKDYCGVQFDPKIALLMCDLIESGRIEGETLTIG